MSNQPVVYANTPQPSNGLGVAGFIVSLVGFVTCGLLCPIGFILSAVALRKQPRGMAVAGFVIGLLGSIIPIVLFLVWGFSVFSCLTLGTAVARLEARTNVAIETARQHVEDYRTLHNQALPNDIDGNAAILSDTDGWGRPLQYRKIGPNQFEIRSAGPDGRFSTPDDRIRIVTEPPGPQIEN